MTEQEREEVKALIEDEIQSLNRTITSLEVVLTEPVLQSDANDWFTSKESNASKDINEQALGKARRTLTMLKNILVRIDNPDFGICSVCKKPIPFERIKAIPTANCCVSCVL